MDAFTLSSYHLRTSIIIDYNNKIYLFKRRNIISLSAVIFINTAGSFFFNLKTKDPFEHIFSHNVWPLNNILTNYKIFFHNICYNFLKRLLFVFKIIKLKINFLLCMVKILNYLLQLLILLNAIKLMIIILVLNLFRHDIIGLLAHFIKLEQGTILLV